MGTTTSCGVAADYEPCLLRGGFGDAIRSVRGLRSDPEPLFMTGLQSPCSVAIGDGRLYFGEVSDWMSSNGQIGRSNLDGTGVERGIACAKYPCEIAVYSLSFGPAYVAPPPLPPWTPCSIEGVRVNKWNGSALVLLKGPAYWRPFHVTARALALAYSFQAPALDWSWNAGRVALVYPRLAGRPGTGRPSPCARYSSGTDACRWSSACPAPNSAA